jgi:hypothetical protein
MAYIMKTENWSYKNSWLVFYFTWNFDISFELCGYFDNRPRINLDLIFFNLTLIMPLRNGWTDECDPPKWGIAYHHQTIWIYRGGKGNWSGGNEWWTMYVPWSYQWVRTSNLRKDGTWEHETKGNIKDFYKDGWEDVIWNETYPYTYILKDGTVQKREATIKVEEREWRWHWFKWLPLTKKVRRTIAIDFNGEVGEGTGSWKGGTMGCGYELLPNETPLQCLRRMERERKFNR